MTESLAPNQPTVRVDARFGVYFTTPACPTCRGKLGWRPGVGGCCMCFLLVRN